MNCGYGKWDEICKTLIYITAFPTLRDTDYGINLHRSIHTKFTIPLPYNFRSAISYNNIRCGYRITVKAHDNWNLQLNTLLPSICLLHLLINGNGFLRDFDLISGNKRSHKELSEEGVETQRYVLKPHHTRLGCFVSSYLVSFSSYSPLLVLLTLQHDEVCWEFLCFSLFPVHVKNPNKNDKV